MNGTTHKIGGTCAAMAVAISKGMEWKSATIFVLASYLGSIMPDIDEPNSTIGRRIKPISVILNKIFKHRGMIHTPFFLAVVNVIALGCLNLSHEWLVFLNGFNVGFISHLLLDLLTPQGIRILYPLSKIRFKVFGLTSGNRDLFCSLIIVIVTTIIVMI